jgi:hypothetical protein
MPVHVAPAMPPPSADAVALRGPLRECLHYHLGHDQLRTRRVWQGVQRLTTRAEHPPIR